LRNRQMKQWQGRVALLAATTVLILCRAALSQTQVPVRRALPVEPPPVARALPVETATPASAPTILRALPVPSDATASAPSVGPAGAPPVESAESPEQRQLNYANALFGRKLYDLSVPEYEKFLGLYPDSSDRATALFYLGQAYRALNRLPAARTSFQSVLRDFPASELEGPASYGLAEIYFNEK